MTIKSRISLSISIFFSILLGVLSFFIIYNYSEYRREEFKDRLRERAYTGIRMMLDMKKVDNSLLALVDSTSGGSLHNESLLIFDSNAKLCYSSVRDAAVEWSAEDIKKLRASATLFKEEGDSEVYGMFYSGSQRQYYVIVSAHDVFGKRKLEYLLVLVITSYVIFIIATWIFTFTLVKQQLKPLDNLYGRMNAINDLNIYQSQPVGVVSDNEVDLLGEEFNLMMNRIAEVYHQQKDFTAHASHELRTPLLRLSAKLENRMLTAPPTEDAFLRGMLQDITHINELIEALLLLTSAGRENAAPPNQIRIDEILFYALETVSKQFPDVRVELTVDEKIMQSEEHLTVRAQRAWLEIAFANLLRNAYLYGEDKTIGVMFGINDRGTFIEITNNGPLLSLLEQQNLFQPFMRGANAMHTKGLGIGLTIVQRVLRASGFHISYSSSTNVNSFRVQM